MTPTTNSLPLRIALSALEVPVALGLGFCTLVLVFKLGCAWTHCVDMSGVPWLIAGCVVGLSVAVAYWAFGIHLGARFRTRLAFDGAVVLFCIGVAYVPEHPWGSRSTYRPPRAAARVTPAAPLPAAPEHPPAAIAK